MSGRLTALDSRCAHMGAHLGQGTVVGDRLRCGLHHWMHDPAGRCRAPEGSGCLSQLVYPVQERYGAVFVFMGAEPVFDLPRIAEHGAQPFVAIGTQTVVRTSWAAIATNAFDIAHMQAVHKRAMRQPPEVCALGAHGLELRYVSRVTGSGLADRLMQWLSGDVIRVTIRCWGGTLITVRSDVGGWHSQLLLCVTPVAEGATVTPLFAVPRTRVGAFDAFRALLSGWLFTAFLKRDLIPLARMDLRLEGALQAHGPLSDLARWLLTVPAAETQGAPERAGSGPLFAHLVR